MTTLQLANADARLAYLALRYHLARPGSELDHETRQRAAHGLAEVERALEPQLEQAVATIELNDEQRRRLLSAVAGAINELKSYPLMAGAGRGAAPGFDEALRRLYPGVAADPEEALQLAGHLVALRRRLERAEVADEPPSGEPAGRPWWRFWARGDR
jgi:hypothetical protein